MLQELTRNVAEQNTPAPRLYADIITHISPIRQAQRLRYETFCEEYAVTLPVNGYWNGQAIDVDEFDDHCIHFVVRETLTGDIVGYTRALPCDRARIVGDFYSSHEFDLDAIKALPGKFLEIGRTCIRKDYRNGATIAVLWGKLAQYLLQHGYNYLFGCASISLADGGLQYASIMNVIRTKHLSAPEARVTPKLTIPDVSNEGLSAMFPPLLKAYTRMGAKICGEACWDPDFNVADVFVLLDTNEFSGRYAKHFFRAAE